MRSPARGTAARAALLLAALGLLPVAAAAARAPVDPMNTGDATAFPRAHGAHPGAAVEWWYVTGELHDASRRHFGFEVTFFRARVDDRAPDLSAEAPSYWRPGDLYFAHYAISDLSARFFRYDERIGRTGPAGAGADSTDLRVWIRDWSLTRAPNGTFTLMASGELGTLALALSTRLPKPVAWGPDYVSFKTADRALFSRYHSYPRMSVRGTFTPKGEPSRAVSGAAWYDHEWSDGERDPDLSGWDWFGLRFGDGRSLMLYRMRGADGETRHLSGGIVEREGPVRPLGPDDVRMIPTRRWVSPRTGASYPVAWRIRIEPGGATRAPIDLTVEAALSDQELVTTRSTRVTYWEGVVGGIAAAADGSTGVEGYMELTGYAGGGAPGALRSLGGAAKGLSTSESPGR